MTLRLLPDGTYWTYVFPAPVNGVITLLDNTTYFFGGTIDLAGNRIVAGQNTTIIGGSSESSILKSTGLTGQALITSQYSLPLRNFAITADIALDLNGADPNTAALDWFGVNFVNCGTVGTVQNYANFIATDCAWLESGPMTFGGTIGTVGFTSCIFNAAATKTAIIVPSTANITRRFRVVYSAFVILSGETGINLSASATIPNEGYILSACNFSGGGTYLAGLDNTSEKALFTNCRGIVNTSTLGHCYMTNNVTTTTVTANTFTKVLGTTTAGPFIEKFTHTNNRLTYTGALSGYFQITAVCTIATANNTTFNFRVAKNGTDSAAGESTVRQQSSSSFSSATSQDVFQLNTGDYIEVFMTASSSGSYTVQDMSVLVKRLN